jgi:peptide deformylase
MDLHFTYYPDPLLENKCREVEDIKEALEIGNHMKEMCLEHGGVGLAANQAGIDLCMAIVAFPDDSDEFRDLRVVINPKIIFESPEKELGKEGCLSFPGLYLNIERSTEIVVQAYIEGKGYNTFRVDGFLARIFCHEVDHLNGTSFYKRLPPIEHEMIKPRLDEIATIDHNVDETCTSQVRPPKNR